MKSTSAGLDAHLASETTSLATCWKCTRTDGVIFTFTDHDRNLLLPLDGRTYSASTGYTRTAIQSNSELSVDNLDLEGAFVSAAVTEADIRAGLWDFATVAIFLVNWADLTQGVLRERKGTLGQVRTGRNHFVTELRGLMQRLQQSVGRLYGMACDADFGDARCGLNAALFTVTGTVDSVTSRRVFFDAARAEAEHYFTKGRITFTSGLNAGLSMDVKLFGSGTVELQLPMPYDIAPGDGYSMVAGCRKRKNPDCKDKFNNVVNHRGFDFIPGIDQIASGGL